jgi:uncharacterized LabA/DUF88 family protein
VDRCALFVDAGYVLADGAMAVHGTRRGESVSWDYEGLLQLLSSLAADRSGLPLLRCYWYEATVDGRRTAEQDALADVPGIKLRVAKIRPGRREGVETEIHRDLTTLARNNAISDALVVSAEEDLAQVIADVQDLGLRVTLVHIAVDGNWTISRALRQESDDILEIGGEHLRPYVELIAGAEPVHANEQDDTEPVAARPMANGHSTAAAASYQPMPAAANHATGPRRLRLTARPRRLRRGRTFPPGRTSTPRPRAAARTGRNARTGQNGKNVRNRPRTRPTGPGATKRRPATPRDCRGRKKWFPDQQAPPARSRSSRRPGRCGACPRRERLIRPRWRRSDRWADRRWAAARDQARDQARA